MKFPKRIIKIWIRIAILSVISIWAANKMVCQKAAEKTFASTSEIPYNKVGLLLGTAKFLSNGQINLYYKYRI